LHATHHSETASIFLSECVDLAEINALIARKAKVKYTICNKTLVDLVDEAEDVAAEIDSVFSMVLEAVNSGKVDQGDVGDATNSDGAMRKLKCISRVIRNGIHQIVIRTLSGFCYLRHQLAY
jgi:hypothetical protein